MWCFDIEINENNTKKDVGKKLVSNKPLKLIKTTKKKVDKEVKEFDFTKLVGVGKVTDKKLKNCNIRTLKDLTTLSLKEQEVLKIKNIKKIILEAQGLIND